MGLTQDQSEQLNELLDNLEPHMGEMNKWEQGFLADQIDRYREHGSAIFMSSKQWKVLRDMSDKYLGGPELD